MGTPKQHRTWQEQAKIISSRMSVDGVDAESALKSRNYFRLSGYWFPMRNFVKLRSGKGANGRETRAQEFAPGHSFIEVTQIYQWDSRLRLHLFEGIAKVELALRSQVAYVLSAHSPMAHRHPEVFNPKFSKQPTLKEQCKSLLRKRRLRRSDYEQWLMSLENAIAREKNADDAIGHQVEKYGDVHIWALVEIIEFLPTIKAFKSMRQSDRQSVSNYFGIEHVPTLVSIFEALNNLRNKAAHHARIWNRNFSRAPALPLASKYPHFESIPRGNDSWEKFRLYPLLCSLAYLLENIEEDDGWAQELVCILDEFPSITGFTLRSAGVPDNWRKLPAWKNLPATHSG